MAQRNIDFGTFPNDPDADAIRTAFEKVQQNFTELFSGLDEQAVLSVTGQPGGGITAFPTTGNVVLTANLACLQVRTSTLSIGRDANGSQSAVITQSSQELIVDLPANIVNVANANFSGTVYSNAFVANNSISSSNTISATGNITGGNLSTSGVIVATGNANVGNVGAVSGVFTANLSVANNISATNVWANSGSINAANANIVGNIVTGNANLGNLAKANFFQGDGSLLSNVTSAPGNLIINGTSQVFVSLSGNVSTTVAGFNTQVVTTTGVNVAGYGTFTSNLTAANANLGNAASANFFIGNFYGTANSATSATTAGTVTTAAQPNITSVGTLTSLGVNGTVTAVAFTANTGVFTGNGSGLSAIAGANVTGAVASATAATTAGTVTTNSQPNITSVGTLSSLTVTGNANVGNLNTAGKVVASTLESNVATGTPPLVVTSTTTVANLAATTATTAGTVTTAAQSNITSVGTLTGLAVNGNITAANITANTGVFTGNGSGLSAIAGANVTGTVSSATTAATAGTVTTAAQPNITSVGTLTSLGVNGTVTAVAFTANTGVFTGNGNGLSSIVGANVTGTVSSATTATTAGTVTTASQPNITSVGTLSSLSVTGNLSSGNANLGNLAAANFFQGDGSLLTNITVAAGSFINNGTSNVVVDASGNVRTSVAGNANILVVTGTGANISGYANVSGNLAAGNISATLVDGTLSALSNAQPNITSLGTLTALGVNGVSNLGPNSNVIITGGINGAFLKTNGSGNLTWDTATLVPAQGTNTQVIFNDGGSNYAGNSNLTFDKTTGNLSVGGLTVTNSATFGNVFANSGTVRGSLLTGTLTTAAQPNITSVGSLTSLIVGGNINAGNVSGGNLVSANFVTGTLTTAAQPNITSLGTLTALSVNNTITAVNITANTGVFTGNANGLNNIPGANVTGTVANATFATTAGSATTAGTVTTNAQPNITSVGSLTSLIVSGNAIAGNVYANSGTIGAGGLTVAPGSVNQLVVSGTNVTIGTSRTNNLRIESNTVFDTDTTVTFNEMTGDYILLNGAGSGDGLRITGGPANITLASQSQIAYSAPGLFMPDGNSTVLAINGNFTSLSVTSNANVGNLGTARVIATGNISGTQLISNIATGTAPLVVTSTTQVANLNAATAGSATTASTVTTAAQPNITSVSTSFTGLTFISNGNITLSGASSQITGANLVSAGFFSGNGSSITGINANSIASGTLAQARLANSSLTVNGTAISLGGSGTITANTTQILTLGSYLTGTSFNGGTAVTAAVDATTTNTASKVVARDTNGSFSANIITATLSGAATTAGTVTTNAQPNITSTGTLTSLTVSGNITAQANVNMTGYVIRSVGTGISAAGSTQGTATVITKEMNVVSTVASGAGVVLPTAVAGMALTVTNTSANALLVYPAVNGIINSQSANAAYSQPAGSTLQFIAPTTTQWYTVGATFA